VTTNGCLGDDERRYANAIKKTAEKINIEIEVKRRNIEHGLILKLKEIEYILMLVSRCEYGSLRTDWKRPTWADGQAASTFAITNM
jgi:hypothetical protein